MLGTRFSVFITQYSLLSTQNCHLMTRSARASTLGGIVRPICLAVFRLLTRVNLVGCSAGRWVGSNFFAFHRRGNFDGIWWCAHKTASR